MDTRPEPPPEGRLIDGTRARAGISVREAARRSGISNTRWGHIVKGYQSTGEGRKGLVRNAPATTIAKMARAVGVTPAQLAAEGRRPDAAAVLAELLAGDEPAAGELSDDDVIAKMNQVAAGIRAEISRRRGKGVPEDQIFAGDEGARTMWAIPLMSEDDRILRIAWLRALRLPRGNPGEPPVELAG